ncbi:PKD domain-containing protein, partial [Lamprobacter modestohalophilus]|uniref:PKD domain-containing protein n=1 Tax=Lamprobacter modestohalophilus TaxID=1064514 RepID=UPI002ADEDBF5
MLRFWFLLCLILVGVMMGLGSSQASAAASLSGKVTDALTGEPLAGATITIAGLNVVSDINGNYQVQNISDTGTLSADFYADTTYGEAPLSVQFIDESSNGTTTLTGSLRGYETYEDSHLQLVDNQPNTYNFAMSPLLATGEVRFVLQWGQNPRDLDSHLITPAIEGQAHHIAYYNRGSSVSPPYAELDVDNVTGYGPETVTLYQRFAGQYHYYVHLYAGTGSLATSDATVRYHDERGLRETITVPQQGTGRYWYVGTVDGATGRLTIVNRIQEFAPAPASALDGPANLMPGKSLAQAAPRAAEGLQTWEWDFGDGNSSSERNPTHVYTTPGLYNVTLTVTNSDGLSSTYTRSQYIEVARPTGTNALDVSVFGPGSVASRPAGISCEQDCSEEYLFGTEVTLTATPNTGATFTGWAGDCSGNAQTCTLVMDEAHVVAANFDLAEVMTRLSGLVTDATTGEPLPGVLVTVGQLTETTDSEGRYVFENLTESGSLSADFYGDVTQGDPPLRVQFEDASSNDSITLNAALGGYDSYLDEHLQVAVREENIYDFSMSPELIEGEMRIVLRWGENPSDLDSHLLTPEIEGNRYHIAYYSRGSENSPPYAGLDVDDVTSYGPETITLYRRFEGVYHYYVHLFAGSGTLATSEATVRFFDENGLRQTLTVPERGTGRYWHVATLDGATGQLTLINRIVEQEPTQAAGMPASEQLSPGKPLIEATPRFQQGLIAWDWSFGDGFSSNEQNPVHVYATPGTFDVSLTVTNDQGARDTMVRSEYITVSDIDIAHIISTTARPVAGGSISCDPNPVPNGAGSTCTATPNEGYSFIGWSGDCDGNNPSCTLSNVSVPQRVFATFSEAGITTEQSARNYVPGDTLTITGFFNDTSGATMRSLVWSPEVPSGWSITSVSG